MIDCSWLKWAIQYVEHHDPLTERLARESKPLSDRLIEQNQDRPPPMSPRGTFPPLTVVNNDWGGRLHEYEARWQQVAIGGGPVEIMGWCVSGCTLLAAYIPKERLCFGEGAALYFHQARAANDGEVMWSVTKRMIDRFPPRSARGLRPKADG